MSLVGFIGRQVDQVRSGGWTELKRKMLLARPMVIRLPLTVIGFAAALVMLAVIRIIRPVFLVRVESIVSWRIGHFAGNLEMYACERDANINVPRVPHVDLWYHPSPVFNRQLDRMWRRRLHIGPRWLLEPLCAWNALIPGGRVHRIGSNTKHDRDVLNLMDRIPAHLSFLPDEEATGEAGLRALGIPAGAPFVCLNVRDAAYLTDQSASVHAKVDWSYHDYRNCSIERYVMAAEALAARGYYVVRMGALVKEPMSVANPMVIDYAANGMRTDFMDIYLGARCAFCISNGSGFDAVPYIFRRPIVYVDMVPIGYTWTFSSRFLTITKKLWLRAEQRFMTFAEIFDSGAAWFNRSADYEQAGIDVVESEPDEIAAVVLEMESRLAGTWQSTTDDEKRQRRFWEIFRTSDYHGEIRSRIGSAFLRQHSAWLGGA